MKKTFKEKKGFTLIELLAVIVVLAIVTVLATTTMLPLMNKAIKRSFILEANEARESAADLMTLLTINTFSDSDLGTVNTDYSKGTKGYCITLKQLAKMELYDKSSDYFESGEYEGKVIITTTSGENSNNYTYRVIMHNKSYYVDKTGNIAEDDEAVVAYTNQNTGYTCTAGDVSGE